ncbi:glutaredoxin family protein [Bacillus sp. KH172YL63]|uniref:glutaredoxin family protein n=1 Tax=Bacillus sp. KH172YL63 TaxID=2709784 RepID=UPI0013E5091C|nr:glutaredoxin domain-containing protein [Bacillus sp. KH172YL63]BCB05405.1 glutaredoxin 3 [Bacillus sp. KH172YL63]
MNNITVYTTNRCPYCVMMKNFLQSQQIEFTEVNVEQQPAVMQEIVRVTGQMGVPQTNVNGQWILGFDPDKVMAAIGR